MSPIHPAEADRPGRADPPHDLVSALRDIVSASDIRCCHTAIAAAARLLEVQGACGMMAAELAPSQRDGAPLWQAGHVTEDDVTLENWFAHARRHESRLLNFGASGAGIAVAAGPDATATWFILLADAAPPQFLRRAMDDVAHMAAQQLHRLRNDAEAGARRRRLDAEGALDAALIRAAADLIWESDANGILRVTHVHHGRNDLAKRLEGRRLSELLPDAQAFLETGDDRPLQRLAMPEQNGEVLLASVIQTGEGKLRGTVVAGASPDQAISTTTLEAIMESRRRVEKLRTETEAMMLGLRLLLGESSFHERLEQLARHLGEAIRADDMRLLQVRPGEPPRLLFPDIALGKASRKLDQLLEGVATLALFKSGGDDAAFLQKMLDMRAGDIVLVALPAPTERYYLLCRAREGLSHQDLGTAERISMLLKHALVMHADQQRMIHAGKLSALGQMSTSLAHELRQPLNTISIAAQNIELMLEMDTITPEILQEKSGARILSQVDRACKVMDRMRRFGRKTTGTHVPVSLAAIAHSARSLMDKITSETGIAIEVSVADGIHVLADELEIEQVLVNLIQNAADAIHEKKTACGLIRIFAADDDDGSMIRLQVADNGPGIPAEVQRHALDAFFTTKAQDKGTGLGLSIAHSILREHGGRLLIGNGEQGALVTLILRRASATVTQLRPRS